MRYVVAMMLIVLTILDMTVARVSFADEPLSMGRESLQGLPGVSVLIEHISPEARADGLSKEAIRTSVELILRASGILVTTEKKAVQHALPLLYVRINAAKVGPKLYAYCTDVQLEQMVSLRKHPERATYATTWSSASIVGTLLRSNVRNTIIEAELLTKQFANDFLAVNPW